MNKSDAANIASQARSSSANIKRAHKTGRRQLDCQHSVIVADEEFANFHQCQECGLHFLDSERAAIESNTTPAAAPRSI